MDKSKRNIAVVGYGFVGKSIAHGFRNCNLVIADPNLGTSTKDLLEFDGIFDAIFIAVPTPMGPDGKINSDIVEKVMDELSGLDTILVLKSTVVPDTVEKLAQKYTNFVYNPEFLTEKNALNDFVNPFMHVFGGEYGMSDVLTHIYEAYSECDMTVPMYYMSAKEASFVKYTMNSYLTTKVLFFNQIADLCQKHGANYGTVMSAVGTDSRIGHAHTSVPGHDGRRGAGSACFSKDVPAFIHFSENELSILREVWNSNVDIRNSYGEPLPRELEQHITFNKI